jgi:hypothetical protein
MPHDVAAAVEDALQPIREAVALLMHQTRSQPDAPLCTYNLSRAARRAGVEWADLNIARRLLGIKSLPWEGTHSHHQRPCTATSYWSVA